MGGLLTAAVGFLLAAAWPLRGPLASGGVAGSGPDITVTLWGMWWFSQEWTGPAWHGVSTLANFPSGTVGGVLSPMTSTMWAGFRALLGAELAVTVTDLLYLGGWCAAVAWLARLSGLGRPAAALAGVLALHGRYLVYAVGETSLVGITAIPALVAVGALLQWRKTPSNRWLYLYVGASAAVGLEYPYLVPLPALIGAALWWSSRDKMVLVATIVATAFLLACAGLTGRGQVTFGSGRIGDLIPLFGLYFPAAEQEIARAAWPDMLWPTPVVWSTAGVEGTLLARGREYVGLAAVFAALAALKVRRRQVLPWLAVACLGMILASGSSWFGHASPFALLNSVAAKLVRPLTQPTRFLVLTSACLPIAAAHLIEHVGAARRWLAVALAGVLVADAVAFGGLSLEVPTTHLPDATCARALGDLPRTAVVTLPWDALSDGEASLHAREWQLLHGQAGPVFGVGSWTLVDDRLGTGVLDEVGLGVALVGEAPYRPAELRSLGYSHLVIDRSVGEWVEDIAAYSLGKPHVECPGAVVYRLAEVGDLVYTHPEVTLPPGWRQRAAIRTSQRMDRSAAPTTH